MKKSLVFLFAAALTTALTAGCNSNNNNNNNGFGTACGAPPKGFQMLYPRNNAGKIPPGNANAIYVAFNPPLVVGNSYNLLASQSNGNQQFTNVFATYTGPIPSPHNSPSPGSTVYVSQVTVSPIGPLQTVNLFWNNGGTGCTPNVIIGTFTTSQ